MDSINTKERELFIDLENGSCESEGLGLDCSRENARRKASKPPRPPKSPPINASDKELVREMFELTRLKRARLERMKAFRKMKNGKKKKKKIKSGGYYCAWIITIVFCAIVIWQGYFSKSSPAWKGSTGSSLGSIIKFREEFYKGPPHSSYLRQVSEQQFDPVTGG